ncbi:MAG: DUF1826 domain-containing protein [Oceanobacter sp.]
MTTATCQAIENSSSAQHASEDRALANSPYPQASISERLYSLTDIYQDEINLAVWQRTLPDSLTAALEAHLASQPPIRLSVVLSPEEAEVELIQHLKGMAGGSQLAEKLAEVLAELVDVFCCLFELERAGLRLTTLDSAMCPKFHVDKVPCRLVSTLIGPGSEWLENHWLNREGLGAGAEHHALYPTNAEIQHLNNGDVALFKGERWIGNEGRGLVHRSPAVETGAGQLGKRLILTLDFAD